MRDSGTERLEPEQLAVNRPQTHAAILMGINSSFRHAADGGSGRIIEIVEARCKLPMVGLKTLNDLETALRKKKTARGDPRKVRGGCLTGQLAA
jgi:hypothetical protein